LTYSKPDSPHPEQRREELGGGEGRGGKVETGEVVQVPGGNYCEGSERPNKISKHEWGTETEEGE